jgi:hypothetical protein
METLRVTSIKLGIDQRYSGNPIIRHKYTADPTAIVFEERVYLYTGHDEPPPGKDDYVMNDWLCFSSANLKKWTEHPIPLSPKHFSWASGDAYASKWSTTMVSFIGMYPLHMEQSLAKRLELQLQRVRSGLLKMHAVAPSSQTI